MIQLDLFETGDLQPIQKWLHVWTDAQRAEKTPTPGRLGTMQGELAEAREGSVEKKEPPK